MGVDIRFDFFDYHLGVKIAPAAPRESLHFARSIFGNTFAAGIIDPNEYYRAYLAGFDEFGGRCVRVPSLVRNEGRAASEEVLPIVKIEDRIAALGI